MQMVSENDIDIALDEYGQVSVSTIGEAMLVSDDECWLQDLKNELLTEEAELFYEDEDGDNSYGYGLLNLMQAEYDEFAEMEIEQRINAKLAKREYIDATTVHSEVKFYDDRYHIHVSFSKVDESKEHNIDIESDGVEVILE